MDFALSDTQVELQTAARRFAEKRLKPVVAKMDEEAHYDPVLMPSWASGLFGLTVPMLL